MPKEPLATNWTVHLALAILAITLAAGQFWLSHALAVGQFGRTPVWAVVVPLFVWFVFDIIAVFLFGRFLIHGRIVAVGWLVIVLVCAAGTYSAGSGLMGLGQVT
jgi:hypothetical protein